MSEATERAQGAPPEHSPIAVLGSPVLFVFAHPDDESILAAGLMARLAAEGAESLVWCATRGENGPICVDGVTREELGDERERELAHACAAVGARVLEVCDFGDGELMRVPWPAIEERIVRAIRIVRPASVVTFGPEGLYHHQDHVAVHYLATAAARSAADGALYSNLAAEGLGPHAVRGVYYAQWPLGALDALLADARSAGIDASCWGIAPELFGSPPDGFLRFDVTPFVDAKMAAIRSHRTQLGPAHVFTVLPRDIALAHLGVEYLRPHDAPGPAVPEPKE